MDENNSYKKQNIVECFLLNEQFQNIPKNITDSFFLLLLFVGIFFIDAPN